MFFHAEIAHAVSGDCVAGVEFEGFCQGGAGGGGASERLVDKGEADCGLCAFAVAESPSDQERLFGLDVASCKPERLTQIVERRVGGRIFFGSIGPERD